MPTRVGVRCLFSCCSVLLFGFVFLGPLGPLSVRSRRPYESLWFCANSSGAKNVEEISTKVFAFFVLGMF